MTKPSSQILHNRCFPNVLSTEIRSFDSLIPHPCKKKEEYIFVVNILLIVIWYIFYFIHIKR